MPYVVERTFVIEKGTLVKFEQLSREGIWPYMEARGCKILGLFAIAHGGQSDEVVLLTAYDSLAHWEATRLNVAPPGASDELKALAAGAAEAGRQRNAITVRSSTRVLRPITTHVPINVHSG